VAISSIVYHYILTDDEPALEHPNVWSAIQRPKVKPVCTRIPGIRDTFCFRVAVDLGDACILAFRELSCRRRFCLAHCWTECTNKDAGPWKRVVMTCTAAASISKTRGQRTAISMQRQNLAKLVQPGEVLALESPDDAEGFSSWLARAEGAVYTHCGPKETKNGRTFITGGALHSCALHSLAPRLRHDLQSLLPRRELN
jgi:hypothetical protein